MKNYLSDISRFIAWFESALNLPFDPNRVTAGMIKRYLGLSSYTAHGVHIATGLLSARSIKRHQASLNKFFDFLSGQQLVKTNPFSDQVKPHTAFTTADYNSPASFTNHIKLFKDFLYTQGASGTTMKNYLLDIRQFLAWLQTVAPPEYTITDLYKLIDKKLIESYKNRLLTDAGFSALSVNRKLSSLRKYLSWAHTQGLIGNVRIVNLRDAAKSPDEASDDLAQLLEDQSGSVDSPAFQTVTKYSRFPPLRLWQAFKSLTGRLFDGIFIAPLASAYVFIQLFALKLGWGKIFRTLLRKKVSRSIQAVPSSALDTLILNGINQGAASVSVLTDVPDVSNITKSFYAPLDLALSSLPLPKRILHYLRYKRPEWYKKYHGYRIVHYLHFALLLVFIGALVFWIQFHFFELPLEKAPVFASLPVAPPRILSFKGRLTDEANTPVTASSALRFSLYKNREASGSALLWQEVLAVSPDAEGNFIATLGRSVHMNEDIFTRNPDLWLGISRENRPEMAPRQKLATVGLAKDAESLQGMRPITLTDDTANTLLALDSAGNLTIGGSQGPLFQATEGTFRISGQALLLATNQGTNGDLLLAPDGTGRIDIQKGLMNSTENNFSGAAGSVEVLDTFAVLATSSAVAALNIEQNGTGLLISASSSGTAKFSLDYQGNMVLNGNLAVNGQTLTTNQTTFSLFPDSVVNLHIGQSATEITVGALSGTTTVNNSLQVNRDTVLGENQTDRIFLNGSISSDIIASESGKFNLGSAEHSFSNAYLTNLFLSPQATTSGFLRKDNNAVSFVNTQSSLFLGGTGSTNALIKLAGESGQDTFFNAGKVGIGLTGSIQDTLQVNGDVRVGKAGTDGCLKRFDGTALIGSCSSDIRLKKNIQPIEDVLGKLTSLRPVTYTMRSDEFPEYGFGSDTAYGLIAQEVETVFPQLVSVDEHGYKTVRYGTELSMLTLAGLKELSGEFNELKMQSGKEISVNGDLLLEKRADNQYIVRTANPDSIGANGNIIEAIGGFAQLTVANLRVGLLNAREASFESVAIATEKFTIAGTGLREYILSVIESSPLSNRSSITTPFLAADTVKTRFLSPMAEDAQIGIRLENSQLSILDSQLATGSAVAIFDRQGNATLSGTLNALGVNTSDASVSGTLKAGRIVADTIDGLDDKLATLAAGVNQRLDQRESATTTNIYNIYNNASNSAQENTASNTATHTVSPSPTPTLISIPQNSDQQLSSPSAGFQLSTLNSQLLTSFMPLGSASAALAYVPQLNSDFTTVHQGLMVLGTTSVSDIAVAGQLSIGSSLILAENSINVLGSSLELQPLRQGMISLMGGLVAIDTDGNLSVAGNAVFAKNLTVKGKLAANLIAPVPGSDLIIQLPGYPRDSEPVVNNAQLAYEEALHKSSLVVKNASGSGVLAVNNIGDLVASGTGAFKNIAAGSLNIVRGASADTSAIDTVASGSAGIAAITAGYTSRTIYSPYVSEDSLIYISPRSQTTGSVPYLARQNPDNPEYGIKGSFTVQIPTVTNEEIQFNWWIIN